MTLDDLKGATLQVSPASALSADDKRLFEEVAWDNISKAWYYDQPTQDGAFDSLARALHDPSPTQQFYTLRINGNLTNFLRIVPTEDPKTMYLASFNSVGPRGSGLGRPFFESIVRSLGQQYNIRLSYDPLNPAGAMYREWGFVEVGKNEIPGSSRAQIVAVRPRSQ